MIKAIIGMIKWKLTLRRCRKMEPYTEEWWDTMLNALQFVPESAREGMFNGFIQLGLSL